MYSFNQVDHGCLSRASRSTTDEDYESDYSDGGTEVIIMLVMVILVILIITVFVIFMLIVMFFIMVED